MSAGQHTSKGAITPRLAEIAELSYPARVAHLTAVWAFSVSQPIFSLLGANPEFMVVRRATTLEVVVFAVALTFAAPIAGVAIEWLVAIVSRTAAAALHAGLVGVFFLPFALQMVKEVDVGVVFTFACATAMAALVVANYLVWRPVRLFLSVLFALPVVGLVGFVTSVPLAQESAASINVSVSSQTPVVVLVMDEFPVSSLMTANGTIDAARYPNFARLGRSAIWYPRATSVHEHTTGAVPAMLTGSIPEPGDLPTLTDHPNNLFTLLGDSHAYNAEETDTVLCPQRYCAQRRDPLPERLASLFSDAQVAYLHRVLPKSMAGSLPPIGDRWGGFRDRDGLLIAEN